ncbi:OLC1v1037576C1 [Oldenlandia corymbosa var. corymbosa]|uniref:OLC1v1037576C1 n=1 Tax=Oldenlandia corymbosa var. corymbosa TaxID=529605 RepID=A0AAV1CXT5_OLDCO|nr:OLC1v1037576C1 [Oldenlandia corymbosa var. corymbosa]
MMAVCKSANNKIVPVVFVLVDEEIFSSWKWFLKCLKEFVIQNRKTCIISNRHLGILSAIDMMLEQFPNMGMHRFCLEHIKANIAGKFPGQKLRSLYQRVGFTLNATKCVKAWEKLANKSPATAQCLDSIGANKWTILGDGGNRWVVVTTNASESYNNALKGARLLPIIALIKSSLLKTVKLFNDNYEKIEKCQTILTPHYMAKYNKWMLCGMRHKVTVFSKHSQLYEVVTGPHDNRPWKGRKTQEVQFGAGICTCLKWQT